MTRNNRRGMPRRDFFKLLGGGIIVFFLPRCASDGSTVAVPLERDLPKDYNAFLRLVRTEQLAAIQER